ncbi:MAG: hypothetical protein N838_32050 [Thiohalocapsa sp. PB-PSB1]|nr:MAG: hypothetical protein N838_32050 [Thiohalocapsa sp. PB-PSB1]
MSIALIHSIHPLFIVSESMQNGIGGNAANADSAK